MKPESKHGAFFPHKVLAGEPGPNEGNIGIDRLPSLDGMRGLAIIVVLMCHATDESVTPAVKALFPYFNGLVGVRLFFVISGFLITSLLLGEQRREGNISLIRFYQRRFIRLFPIQASYILFLFLLTRFTSLKISTCRFLTALIYLKNYACAGKIDGHMWTLSVEEQFYLIWPLILVLTNKIWTFIFAFLFIFISPFSRVYEYKFEFSGGTNPIWWWLTSNSDVIMIGCLAGLIYRSDWVQKCILYHATMARMVALIMIVAPPILTNYLLLGLFTVTLGPTVQALGAAYLVLSTIFVRRGFLYKILNCPMLVTVGLMSYSLYVWQEFFFFATPEDFGLRDLFVFHFPIDLIAAVCVGCLSYFGLEKPLAGLRKAIAERALRTSDTEKLYEATAAWVGADRDRPPLVQDKSSISVKAPR